MHNIGKVICNLQFYAGNLSLLLEYITSAVGIKSFNGVELGLVFEAAQT